MTGEAFRRFCLALPRATEDVKWGNDLCFSIGGKMFAVLVLEPDTGVNSKPDTGVDSKNVWCSFKCTPEEFASLIERPGIFPAPYAARHHWVALEHGKALPDSETKERLRTSYSLVLGKLPARLRRSLQEASEH